MFRLWVHRVFVALSIIQAIRGPIVAFQVWSENMAIKPTDAAEATAKMVGNPIGLFVSIVLHLLILTTLILLAVFTKPKKQD